ncbi:hypothetical protein KQX54_008112 [Cotesia glomerata]|uniref:Uncharacterized protein n=1 Tax=Cotesia glomerata TaxID=32391 RepID=A0AAV7IYC6_COTGL|nr:hypothetical protein KQX54_008112 [Cotesia glomerata]
MKSLFVPQSLINEWELTSKSIHELIAVLSKTKPIAERLIVENNEHGNKLPKIKLNTELGSANKNLDDEPLELKQLNLNSRALEKELPELTLSEAQIHRSSQDCLSADSPKSRVHELVVLAVSKGKTSIRAVISGIELNFINLRVKTAKRHSSSLAVANNASEIMRGLITFTCSNITKYMYFIALTMTYVFNRLIFYKKGLRFCPIVLYCRKLSWFNLVVHQLYFGGISSKSTYRPERRPGYMSLAIILDIDRWSTTLGQSTECVRNSISEPTCFMGNPTNSGSQNLISSIVFDHAQILMTAVISIVQHLINCHSSYPTSVPTTGTSISRSKFEGQQSTIAKMNFTVNARNQLNQNHIFSGYWI